MKQDKYLRWLEEALRAGCDVRAFLSGGGLRVVRVELGGEFKGYGEHLHIGGALVHAAKDYRAGVRPYGEVYGQGKPHYLTGSSNTNSPLDDYMRRGNKFLAERQANGFRVTLSGYGRFDLPKEVMERVLATGIPEETQCRGYIYRSTRSFFTGNGSPCVNTEVTNAEAVNAAGKGEDPWMWEEKKIGVGVTLRATIEDALAAKGQEV